MGERGIGSRPKPLIKKGWVRTEDGYRKEKLPRSDTLAGKAARAKMPPIMAIPPWQKKGLSRAERVIVFCESFDITSGPDIGKKFVLRPWQRDFINAVYRDDGQGGRPVRTAILSMGRKNGKTALAALMALCHLCGPEAEPRGEAYSCANDRAQASKIFAEAEASVLRHPLLADRISISSFMKTMKDSVTGSVFTALSSEARTKMGLSPSFVVYD